MGNNRRRSKSGSRVPCPMSTEQSCPSRGALPGSHIWFCRLCHWEKPSPALQAKLDALTGVCLPRAVSFLPVTHRVILAAQALPPSLGPVDSLGAEPEASGHWAEASKSRTNASCTHLSSPSSLLNKGAIIFSLAITDLLDGMGSVRAE